MINKNLFKIITVTLISMTSIVGCSMKEHQTDGILHHDETNHWYGCLQENCDERFDENAHNWGDWNVIKESSCLHYGEEYRECSVCHRKEKRNIDKEAHAYLSDLKYDEYGHWIECSICGSTKTSSKQEHELSNWVVEKAATVTEEGIERGKCECGFTGTRSIPKVSIPTQSITIQVPECMNNGQVLLSQGSFPLSYTINPQDATDFSEIEIASSDETVATINNGQVQLLKEGFTNIIVNNGVKEDKLPLFVTNNSINIDGTLSTEEYSTYNYDISTSYEAGYATSNKTYVVFGEGGLFISHSVADKYISGFSHIEAALCFGDECNEDNTLFVNFYPTNTNFEHVRFFANATSYSNAKELLGDEKINCAIATNVIKNDEEFEGYEIETFIPYSELAKYGYAENQSFVRYIPLTYQFGSQIDADKASYINSDESVNKYISYGYINTLKAKYENYLMPKFDKNNTFTTPNKAPIVEYTFDNGQIVNTGTNQTVNGRITTIDSSTGKIINKVNPVVKYVVGTDGTENSAVQLSNTKVGGNHFTISGVDLGTNDFTITLKINVLQVTSKTDSSNYLFGIGNKKDAAEGFFNVAYKVNANVGGGSNQIKLRVNGKTHWNGYIPVGEYVEVRIIRKGNVVTFYLGKDATTKETKILSVTLNSTESLALSNYDIGFSSNEGCQNPGDWPTYYDDIKIFDYAIPM